MKYIALAPVAVQAGQLVRLTKAQLVRCAALVERVEKPKGWHRTLAPFQFKAGEAFELEGELPRGLADTVESEAPEAPPPAPQPPVAPAAGEGDLLSDPSAG